MKRVLFGAIVTLGAGWVGFAVGGLVGAARAHGQQGGFAGATLVAVLALGGGVAGLVAGIVVARRVPERMLAFVAILAVLGGVGAWRLLLFRERARAAAAQAR